MASAVVLGERTAKLHSLMCFQQAQAVERGRAQLRVMSILEEDGPNLRTVPEFSGLPGTAPTTPVKEPGQNRHKPTENMFSTIGKRTRRLENRQDHRAPKAASQAGDVNVVESCICISRKAEFVQVQESDGPRTWPYHLGT